MADHTKIDFTKELAKGVAVHSKLQQEVLVTTSDKLRLCLIKHQRIISSRTDCVAPLGILVTSVATICVSSFVTPFWEAIFALLAILSLIWLGYSLYHSFHNIRSGLTKGTDGTIDTIVDELKVKTPQLSQEVAELLKESATQS